MTSPATPAPRTQPPGGLSSLPGWERPLAVVAHPDDESFGLGAVLSAFVDADATPAVLCFTHGEASTLHGRPGDLRQLRAQELRDAARELKIDTVRLLDEPDGSLADIEQDLLIAEVTATARTHAADGLLVFDLGGVTGHPDHDAATRAALGAAEVSGLGVLAWTLPADVTAVLNGEFGAGFVGREPDTIDVVLPVDRARQRTAVAAHPSQAVPGSVLWRRLDLLGDREHLRWLRQGPGPR